MTFVPWVGFIFIVLLVCDWFFRITQHLRSLLTNQTPSVEADVKILMVGASDARNPNADAGRVNVYDRYAATHEVIQRRGRNGG